MFKLNNGLTLVEVLVSVVLTTFLMLYGVSFFLTAWRLRGESADYVHVTYNIISNLEQKRAKNTLFIGSEPIGNNKYTIKYTVSPANNAASNSVFVDSVAKWEYDQNKVMRISAIKELSIKTALSNVRWKLIDECTL